MRYVGLVVMWALHKLLVCQVEVRVRTFIAINFWGVGGVYH